MSIRLGQMWRGIRQTLLDRVNGARVARGKHLLERSVIPSYIVVTPHLAHLAPLAARNHGASIQPVFVGNGISGADVGWLRRLCPDVPIIVLKTSLTGNSKSLLEHGIVINYLAERSDSEFCIQDADCFVLTADFWDGLRLNEVTDYAAGPFLRQEDAGKPAFPETFLLLLNAHLLRDYRFRFGITAETTSTPDSRAQRVLDEAGFPHGIVIDPYKSYYDTLQQFWVVAEHRGFRFKFVPGEGETVFHIGGSSYLHADFSNLEHWDYWALNVQYLNLRLLEFPACNRFRERFSALVEFHGTAGALLARYPQFASGWRRKLSDSVIARTQAADLYNP